MDEKQKIIQEIQRVANTISPKKITKKGFLKLGSISEGKIRYHYGTWNNAVKAAGLTPNPPDKFPNSVYKNKIISDDNLLEEIGRLWKSIGRKPSMSLMDSKGKYSQRPYLKRWESGLMRSANM